MDLAGLLNEDIIEDIVGHAVVTRLHDGGIGQRLMVGHVQALVVEVVAVAHAAAVEALVGEALFKVCQNLVALLLIEVLGRRLGVVVAELHGDVVLAPALCVVHKLVGGIVHVQHAVHTLGRCDTGDDLVGRLLDILRQVARDVDAGDLVAIALGESDHLLRAASRLHGEGRVDIDLVGRGDGVEHALERF